MVQEDQKAENKDILVISIIALLTVLLFIIEIYEIINDPQNLIVLGALGVFILAAVYTEIIMIHRLNVKKKKEQEEAYNNVYRFEKATYLLMRKYFDQMEQKIETMEQKSDIPYEKLVAAQKALAKVQISRNKENISLQMHSNKAALIQGNRDIIAKQEQILSGIKELEESIRNELSEYSNRIDLLKDQLDTKLAQIENYENAQSKFSKATDNTISQQEKSNKEESELDRLLMEMDNGSGLDNQVFPNEIENKQLDSQNMIGDAIDEPASLNVEPDFQLDLENPVLDAPELNPLDLTEPEPYVEEPELSPLDVEPVLEPLQEESVLNSNPLDTEMELGPLQDELDPLDIPDKEPQISEPELNSLDLAEPEPLVEELKPESLELEPLELEPLELTDPKLQTNEIDLDLFNDGQSLEPLTEDITLDPLEMEPQSEPLIPELNLEEPVLEPLIPELNLEEPVLEPQDMHSKTELNTGKSALDTFSTKARNQTEKNENLNMSKKSDLSDGGPKTSSRVEDLKIKPISTDIEPQPLTEESAIRKLAKTTVPDLSDPNHVMTSDEIAAMVANMGNEERIPEPLIDDLDIMDVDTMDPMMDDPMQDMKKNDSAVSDPGHVMSADEIAALIANTETLSTPEPVEKPEMPDLSNPGHVMSPDEIAALIANM